MENKEINPYVYFVERKDNHLWITEKEIDGDNHTFEPHKAMQFKSINQADKYIYDNNLSDDYYSTEHEFTDTLIP